MAKLLRGEGSSWAPTSFYFLRVLALPTGRAIEFPTALRVFGGEDMPTKLEPVTIAELGTDFAVYIVSTYTEYFTPVYASGTWHNEYFKTSRFLAFHWLSENLLVANTSRDVVNGFWRSIDKFGDQAVQLQRLKVNLEKLADGTARARKITLQMSYDSDLPVGGISKASLEGRDVEQSIEVQHYREAGAVGSGLEFEFSYKDWPPVPVAVTSDASVRLLRHIGDRGSPNIGMELQMVTGCWKERVEKYAEVRTSGRAPKQPGGPRTAKGQQALDDSLEGGSTA